MNFHNKNLEFYTLLSFRRKELSIVELARYDLSNNRYKEVWQIAAKFDNLTTMNFIYFSEEDAINDFNLIKKALENKKAKIVILDNPYQLLIYNGIPQ